MMCLSQFINKNNGLCVSCVCLCLWFLHNGTHAQCFNINAFIVSVYHVYYFFYARMCVILTIFLSPNRRYSLDDISSTFNKKSCARKYFINGTHGTHLYKSLTIKCFHVFTILENANHDSKHHKHCLLGF